MGHGWKIPLDMYCAKQPLRTQTDKRFISDETCLTFQELDEATERLACALLNLGIAPGERAIFNLAPQ